MCALPALQRTQQHAAPEVVSASLAHNTSGRLTPFNGPKVQNWLNAGCCLMYSPILVEIADKLSSHVIKRLQVTATRACRTLNVLG